MIGRSIQINGDVRGDERAMERVRVVRERLLRSALRHAPSYGRLIDELVALALERHERRSALATER